MLYCASCTPSVTVKCATLLPFCHTSEVTVPITDVSISFINQGPVHLAGLPLSPSAWTGQTSCQCQAWFCVGGGKEGAARLEPWSHPKAWSSAASIHAVMVGYIVCDPQYKPSAMLSLLGPGSTSPPHAFDPRVRVTQWQLHLLPSTLSLLTTHGGTVLLETQENHCNLSWHRGKALRGLSVVIVSSGRIEAITRGKGVEETLRKMDGWTGCCFMPVWQSVYS